MARRLIDISIDVKVPHIALYAVIEPSYCCH